MAFGNLFVWWLMVYKWFFIMITQLPLIYIQYITHYSSSISNHYYLHKSVPLKTCFVPYCVYFLLRSYKLNVSIKFTLLSSFLLSFFTSFIPSSQLYTLQIRTSDCYITETCKFSTNLTGRWECLLQPHTIFLICWCISCFIIHVHS